jgi:hypothetical protein
VGQLNVEILSDNKQSNCKDEDSVLIKIYDSELRNKPEEKNINRRQESVQTNNALGLLCLNAMHIGISN